MEDLVKITETPAEEKDRIPREVVGVLSVHCKTLTLQDAENDSSSMTQLLQLKVEVCGIAKFLSLSSTRQNGLVVCDQIKSFVIELPEKNDDPDNDLTVELLASSPLLPSIGSVLGKAILHIHTIIHDSPVSGSLELRAASGEVFAVLRAEFVFSYGSLGYGGSYQLQYSVRKPGHYLHFSLFPRLTPQEGRADSNGHVLLPQPTKHPGFIPFQQCASLCLQESRSAMETSLEHSPRQLAMRMSRLHTLHGQMRAIRDRKERLSFIESIVLHSRGSGEQSSDVNVGVTTRTDNLRLRMSSLK